MGPILVTGVPRSGTTWTARLLAGAPGTALAGREPMNPRGRQYALGHTLDGWTRLDDLTPRQRRLLRAAYRGLNPMVYSRFGSRQWAGPLPRTRLIVKDPYALLSMPTVVRETAAVPVVVYRHPGAILASYQRVGWQPRFDEVVALVEAARAGNEDPQLAELPDVSVSESMSEATRMGLFWSVLHEFALADAARSGALFVSHAELASGGVAAGQALADRLGIGWSAAMTAELSREAGESGKTGKPSSGTLDLTVLHNFDRAPAAVAPEWRSKLSAQDTEAVEAVAAGTLAKVEASRMQLG